MFIYTGKCLAGYNDNYQSPLSICAFFPHINVLLYCFQFISGSSQMFPATVPSPPPTVYMIKLIFTHNHITEIKNKETL